ncbi:hypothetical protein BGZ60DRAFT_410194 [Tricladium varicosporioides]|nr:hypothetical protein BGZ60DRAFT_410194 [Hymenoscyphus varicosporioides]
MSPFDGQINISYGDLNLKCPTRPGAWSYHYGMVVMECDDAGLVQAIWELGTSFVEVVGKMWCSGLPQPIVNGTITNQTDFSSLGIRTGFHNLDSVLTCQIPDTQAPTIRSCTQTLPNYSMPVSSFFTTTSTNVSFTPISRSGVKVECPTILGVNPIIDDEAACTHIGATTSITSTKTGTAKVGKRSVRRKLRSVV